MDSQEAIKQIQKIMEDFRAKVSKARSEYRVKIAAILKRIDERNLEKARQKLHDSK